MDAILFNHDGTTRTIEDIRPDTYLDLPVYTPPQAYRNWKDHDMLPNRMTGTWDKRRYVKQVESADYAVFTEE